MKDKAQRKEERTFLRQEQEEKWKENQKRLEKLPTDTYEKQQTVGWGNIEHNYSMVRSGQTDNIKELAL